LRGTAARVRALAHPLHEIGVDGLVHNAETAEKCFDEFARGDARQARRPARHALNFVSREG
jgi:hypothetical protein